MSIIPHAFKLSQLIPIRVLCLNTLRKTGGVLVNTSFNVRGEPIVYDPADAFRCFMGTDMDILVIGNYYMEKKKQNKSLKVDYKHQFELD